MIVKVEVNNLRDLFEAAGANAANLGEELGVAQPTVSRKLSGFTSWYEDELDALVDAIVSPDRVRGVDRTTVVKLVGAKNIKVRGTLADKK
jgi:hypothetical protein